MSGGVNFTLKSDSQFILTCISTGGPATTVTWTRRYYYTITAGTETVLDDPVTAQYTHTLTVTGRQEGVYTCAVTNDVSHDSAQLNVQGLLCTLSIYELCENCLIMPPVHKT